MQSRAEQLLALGQSVWLDYIHRRELSDGTFDDQVRNRGVVGVTSNPTIFQQALAEGDVYDASIARLAATGLSGPALFEALAIEDIQLACDKLRPTYDRTGGRDGRVSIEVSPGQAANTAGTIEEARRLHRSVARANVLVKVPATAEGIPAIAALTSEGISINVTLIFSLARYEQVMEAYLSGLEQRTAKGLPLEGLFSVASFFVSRVDAKVDKAIEQAMAALPEGDARRQELAAARGRTAVANARLAYQRFRAVFGAPRFEALRARGANLQRPLWASTSTKNKAYPDTMYVDELIGADTVNTMPPQTLDAFNDHGTVALAIERDVEGARRLFDRLPALGIPLDRLIGELEPEGVQSFAKSYDTLLEALAKKHGAGTAPSGGAAPVTMALDGADARVGMRLAAFDRDRFAERLWKHDDALWGDDPTHRKVAANRLGWLDVATRMRGETGALREFAAAVRRDGFTHAVLLGMGGSSLAPEVLRNAFGRAPDALELTVLDNTSPAAVRAVAATHDPAHTLFVVSSKSGGTIEVASFEKWFFDWVHAARGDGAGSAFVAITDPGTALERLAASRGYRRVWTNPPDIGGRYSALSYFGLVPAALIGLDLDALLDRALDEARRCGPGVKAAENPALTLGAALGELALAGRDKVTLALGREVAPLGVWIEQLVAESTGKQGKGLVPIADEPLGPPELYGRDRVFVAAGTGAVDGETEALLARLRDAGHPVLRWSLADLPSIGGEFLRWEIATAAAGAVLGVDPFDEPNVTEAKEATRAVLDRFLRDGRFPDMPATATGGGLRIDLPAPLADRVRARANGGEPSAWVAALLSLASPGDYVALLAYLHRTPERHARLERLRLGARAATRLATTLGYGPRFLHSTGQLHKGGPNTGVFLQITCDEGEELPIPGEPYGFGALRRAQAAGDYDVLEKRGRRVMRVHLGADVERGLDALIEAVAAAKV